LTPVGQVGGGSGVVPAYTDRTLVRCTFQYKTHKPATCRIQKWQVGRFLSFLNTVPCLPVAYRWPAVSTQLAANLPYALCNAADGPDQVFNGQTGFRKKRVMLPISDRTDQAKFPEFIPK